MALVLLGLPEFSVSAMEPVQHTKDPETLVEPGVRRDMRTMVKDMPIHSLFDHFPIYSNQESSGLRFLQISQRKVTGTKFLIFNNNNNFGF